MNCCYVFFFIVVVVFVILIFVFVVGNELILGFNEVVVVGGLVFVYVIVFWCGECKL